MTREQSYKIFVVFKNRHLTNDEIFVYRWMIFKNPDELKEIRKIVDEHYDALCKFFKT